MNTNWLNFPLNSEKRSDPSLPIAEIMFSPNRWPVTSLTGVLPFGLHERPWEQSERNPVSSCQSTIPPSRLARARIFG